MYSVFMSIHKLRYIYIEYFVTTIKTDKMQKIRFFDFMVRIQILKNFVSQSCYFGISQTKRYLY